MKKSCPNCKETTKPCACERNVCIMCGKPVGNITFTVCDKCWNKRRSEWELDLAEEQALVKEYGHTEFTTADGST